jgi:Protease II
LFSNLNQDFDSSHLRIRYDSFVTAPTVFDCNLESGEMAVVEKLHVDNHDPSQYHCQQIYATASDGTKVPIVLAWKGDLERNGKRPLYLYGYGAYGMCALWAGHFRMSRLSLLDRGVVLPAPTSEVVASWANRGTKAERCSPSAIPSPTSSLVPIT